MDNPIGNIPTNKEKLKAKLEPADHTHFLPYHIGRDLKEAGGCLFIVGIIVLAVVILPVFLSIFRGG